MTLTTESNITPNKWIRRSFIFLFFPLSTMVLWMDSLTITNLGYNLQWLADLFTIVYFTIMLWGLYPEEQKIAIIFVPFSAIAEYLFSQVFDLYSYRLDNVPLYVPFGHAILFCSGLMLDSLEVVKLWNNLKWILLGFHLLLFTFAIAFWHDGLSAILIVVFAWILRRKGVRSLYGIMGCLVLMIEIVGTFFGCWLWHSNSFGFIHTTNPPVGAFVFYVLADLGGFKISRWIFAQGFIRNGYASIKIKLQSLNIQFKSD